jgi:hypothetical protein
VLLRGRDAVRWAQHVPAQRSVAILNNDHGGTVTIRLDDLEVDGGSVRATVDASEFSEAGEYGGALPLEASGLAGPSLTVSVKVRWSLAAAVLVIFGGALCGGFFLRRFEIRRRRTLLELELLSALARYDEERARSGRSPASHDLDHLLEPRRHDEAATMPYPGTRGVSALLWHIKHARDDADFSEDIELSHALIDAIERWLALEPVARETAALLNADSPIRRSGALSETTTYRDLAYLLVKASTPPVDDKACQSLISALAVQGRVAARCKVIWELLADPESQPGTRLEEARALEQLDVPAIEAGYPPFCEREPAQTDQLPVALDQARGRLRRLHAEIGAPASDCSRVVHARGIEDRMEASSRKTAIERSLPDIGVWRLRLAGSFNVLAVRAVVWTLSRALVAAVAYALVIYSDTWGSVTDVASAFTTGFLTETVVNWAVMPAFRSNRSRKPTTPNPQPPAGANPLTAPAPQAQPIRDNGRTPLPALAPEPPRLEHGEP